MSGIPVCPYCGNNLGESIPAMLQGTIRLRCPVCLRLYGYSEESRSFPIEEEMDYHLSPGPLRRKILVGSHKDQNTPVHSSGGLSKLYLCLIYPLLILLILLAISYVLSVLVS